MQEDWDFQARLSYLPELTPTPTLNKTKLLLSPQTLHKKQLEGVRVHLSVHGVRIWSGRQWRELEAAGSHHICSQEADHNRCWGSAHFLLFNQSRIPVHGLVPSPFRVGLYT